MKETCDDTSKTSYSILYCAPSYRLGNYKTMISLSILFNRKDINTI